MHNIAYTKHFGYYIYIMVYLIASQSYSFIRRIRVFGYLFRFHATIYFDAVTIISNSKICVVFITCKSINNINRNIIS